jgi:DNA-binding transcriptional regulator YbjK
MGRSAKKPPAGEGRKENILQAALRVIGTDGVDALTHRRVAAEAGVPLGSITYYFETRNDLVREAFRYHLDEIGETVAALELRLAEVSATGLVEAIVDLSEQTMVPPRLRAEFEMRVYAARDTAIAAALNSWQKASNAVLAEALEILGVRRPMEGARMLVGAVQGFELERLSRPTATTAELRQRVAVTLAGLLLGEADLPSDETGQGKPS